MGGSMHQNSSTFCPSLEHFLFNTFLHKSKDIIMITDGGSDFDRARILGGNSSFEFISGLTQKQLINLPCDQLFNLSVQQRHSLQSAFKDTTTVELALAITNTDGSVIQLKFEIYPVEQATQYWIWQGKPSTLEHSIIHDQQQNHQSEIRAMETIAAKTAHDFNNILAIIMGNNDLILENSDVSSPFYPLFKSISRAVKKGTHLTKNLLVFSQKNLLSNQQLDLNTCVSSMANGLRENIGSHHVLTLELTEQPCDIVADIPLLQECITNLVINAAQAMYQSGTIIIAVNTVFMAQQKDVFEQMILPQEYVKLTITDTGKGISKANLPLIFTPFFTTRETKAAKGLGLSLVYGFVKNNNGYCLVDTELGKGSSFSLLFNLRPLHSML